MTMYKMKIEFTPASSDDSEQEDNIVMLSTKGTLNITFSSKSVWINDTEE